MRKFYTAQDVEYSFARGETVIYISETDVVTSIAKEIADKKGIRFVVKDKQTASSGNTGIKPQAVSKPEYPAPKIQYASNQKIIAPAYKGLISEQEIEKWRAEFPILKTTAHLGNCSQSAQSIKVRDAITNYLDNWQTVGMDWDSWVEEVNLAKAEFAKVINADPSEIAVTSCVSEAISSIANSLDYSGKRKKVVVTDAEFPTVDYIWLANQRYGAKVDFISVNENHQIDIEEYERYIDENTLITSITQVYYLNGFKQDIAKIAEIAHGKGSLLLVDSYQCLGTEPVDVKKMNIDMLASGCLKYLFGIPGIAFLYVNKDLVPKFRPTVTGWFGQTNPFLFQTRYNDWSETASRLDTGTPPVLNSYAARAGLKIINEVGVERIKDRIDMLSAYALKGCLERGLTTISPFDVNKKGGTTAIVVAPKIDSHQMEAELRKRNIIGSGRGEVIRIAPHFYSKPEEIDYALDTIKQILNEK
ncbi:MAG: aminotransferase class V-fold PLP-dependent enzyme [Clostridiaceae bacterium]|nr:aminotransferase class V-fold PLP-dependent enzyme [Clostridiaceae bacterium]